MRVPRGIREHLQAMGTSGAPVRSTLRTRASVQRCCHLLYRVLGLMLGRGSGTLLTPLPSTTVGWMVLPPPRETGRTLVYAGLRKSRNACVRRARRSPPRPTARAGEPVGQLTAGHCSEAIRRPRCAGIAQRLQVVTTFGDDHQSTTAGTPRHLAAWSSWRQSPVWIRAFLRAGRARGIKPADTSTRSGRTGG